MKHFPRAILSAALAASLSLSGPLAAAESPAASLSLSGSLAAVGSAAGSAALIPAAGRPARVSLTSASAQSMDALSMADLQRYIFSHSPASAAEVPVEVSGTVQAIYYYGVSNHYQLTLEVDDDKAVPPLGSDKPLLAVHFRLHVPLEDLPFQPGDTITVAGTLNPMYSSYICPNIDAEYFNGSDNF